MAKIDDLSELLVEEFHEFKVSLEKLKALKDDISSNPIQPDISGMERLLNDFISDQSRTLGKYQDSTLKLSKKLNRSNTYPNWFVSLFLIFLMSLLTITAINLYQLKQLQKTKSIYFQKGQKSSSTYFNSFLIENPDIETSYNEWRNKQNK